MGEQLAVKASLVNEKVKFSIVAGSNQEIFADYHPPLGDDQGYTGLELLLVSLAACSGTSVLALLRKMRKTISNFNVIAKGIRRDEHPTVLEKIWLEFELKSNDTTDEELQKAIKMSEESICPVWNMLKNSVTIETNFKISGL